MEQLTIAVMRSHVLDKTPLPHGVRCTWSHAHPPTRSIHSMEFSVETVDGPLRIEEGDWVVTDDRGARRLYKPEEFAETYEVIA